MKDVLGFTIVLFLLFTIGGALTLAMYYLSPEILTVVPWVLLSSYVEIAPFVLTVLALLTLAFGLAIVNAVFAEKIDDTEEEKK